MLFFIFSNFQTIYFSAKVFLALQVRLKRKLLKKSQQIPIPTTHLKWKTANHQHFPGTILNFYGYFRNYKKNTFKGTALLLSTGIDAPNQVLKLTKIMGNKYIPKVLKIKP